MARATGRAASRGEIETLIRLQASSALDYTIAIPGEHYGGLTNQELFDILADQGRDFAANTPTLRKFVRSELSAQLARSPRLPTMEELNRMTAELILVWVLKRMDGKVRDVRIRALTERYAREKYRAGYRTPIGTRTGALREAVADATVTVE